MSKRSIFAEPYRAAFSYFMREKQNELGPGSKIKNTDRITDMWDKMDEEERIRYDNKAKEDKKPQIDSMKKSPMRNLYSESQDLHSKRHQKEQSDEQPRMMKRLNKTSDQEEKEQQDSDDEDEQPSKQRNTRSTKPRDVIQEQLDQDMEYLQKVNQQRKKSKPRISIADFDKDKEEKPDVDKDEENKESKSKQEMKKQPEKKQPEIKKFKDENSDEEQEQAKVNEQSGKKIMKSVNKQESSDEDAEMSKKRKQMKSRYSKKRLEPRRETESLIVKDSIEKFIKHFEKCTMK